VEIVVTGRNVEVPEHFKVRAAEKLSRTERYDPKLARIEVELAHEKNRRQNKTKQRVQLTVTGRGPAVRAEASAETFQAALDLAVDKLEERLRRARGRRLDRVTSRAPLAAVAAAGPETNGAVEVLDAGSAVEEDGPGRVVRIKNHPGDPISVDQALWQMELVGHDFYLFNDEESGMPSVVYRRKGFDYGLLRLV
jgi:ribosomal subunit interface protein